MKRARVGLGLLLCLVGSLGCKGLLDKIRNRGGGEDAGTVTTTIGPDGAVTVQIPNADAAINAALAAADAASAQAAAALDAAAQAQAQLPTPMPAAADAGAAPVAPTPTPMAAADAGAAPVAVAPTGDDPPRRRRPRGWCKDHPGQLNPLTGVLCPQ